MTNIIKDNEIVVGAYYETDENVIAYVYRASENSISYQLNNSKSEHIVNKIDFQKWKVRRDLIDYPDAVDPRLPYVFDLNHDIKYTSDLLRELKNQSEMHESLISLIKETKIYENNKKINNYLEKHESNLLNHIKVKEVVYELPTKNAVYTIKKTNKEYRIYRIRPDLYKEYLTEKNIFAFNHVKISKEGVFKSLEECAKLITKAEKELVQENKELLKNKNKSIM